MANGNRTNGHSALSALSNVSTYVPAASHIEVSDEVKQWAEDSYTHWLKNKSEWRQVILPSVKDAEEIITQARAYLKTRETPLTLQLRGKIEPAEGGGFRLVHRVRDKVNSGRKPK